MNHFIEKCKSCQTVISQCRCADHNKEVRWSLCKNCKDIMITEIHQIKEENNV